jgi:hypothetical protein
MLAAAQHLKRIGHNVTFNTSENFRGKVESSGVQFVAMTGKASYDYRDVDALEGYKNLPDADQKILFVENLVCRNHTRSTRGPPTDSSRDADGSHPGGHHGYGLIPDAAGAQRQAATCPRLRVNPVILSSRDCGILLPPANALEDRQQIAEEIQMIHATFQPVGDYID